MDQSQPAPTRVLPAGPNLKQLRKQAKDLLKAFRAGQAEVRAEVEQFEQGADPATFALSDAQRVLARAYGFSSWPALKRQVEGVNLAALVAAAEAGDAAAVRRIARARPDLINHHVGSLGGALHRAVLQRDEGLTRVLMQLGADARVGIWPHRDATSAYAIAVDREYSEIVATIEREEENRRVQLNDEAPSTRAAVDLLRQAIVHGRTVEAIALMDADPALVGARDMHGVTSLHLAARKHDPALVGWLLDRGVLVDARDVEGKTPLDAAAINAGWAPAGRDATFYFMENAHGDPAWFHETARLLLEKGAELMPRAAVALGDREAVLRLHREGRLTNDGPWGLLAIAVRANRLEMVATLLDLGFDPNEIIATDEGDSGWPLWFASMCGRHEIAELLLARGADVNTVVGACGDALGRALDEPMTALLLKHGARVTVEQLPRGEQGREIAKAILAGTMPGYSLDVANPTLQDLAEQMLWASSWTDAEIVRRCLAHTTRPRDDPWWHYVLVHAALPETVKVLLDDGVDPDVRSGEGYTILHHVAWGSGGVLDAENRVARATILLDAGASLSIRDSLLKSTPLGWACRWGRTELVKLYLERDADPLEPDTEPWATPLAWATKRGHHEIVELLHSAGAGA
jgi:ankyrin repeat protein